jgi:hypothetical protein
VYVCALVAVAALALLLLVWRQRPAIPPAEAGSSGSAGAPPEAQTAAPTRLNLRRRGMSRQQPPAAHVPPQGRRATQDLEEGMDEDEDEEEEEEDGEDGRAGEAVIPRSLAARVALVDGGDQARAVLCCSACRSWHGCGREETGRQEDQKACAQRRETAPERGGNGPPF